MSQAQMLRAELEDLRLNDITNELNTVKSLLTKTQEELSHLKEQSKIDRENLLAKGEEADKLKSELEKYSIGASEENNQLELCKSELRRQAEALDKLNEMFSESEEILNEKEEEISALNETIAQNRLEIKVNFIALIILFNVSNIYKYFKLKKYKRKINNEFFNRRKRMNTST